MSYVFYLDDYGQVSANVYDSDGATLVEPISGTATVVNQHNGETIVENAACLTGLGVITYVIPDGSAITQTSARYIFYLTTKVDATTQTTVAIPVDVIDKGSHFVVDRWRRKVEFSAPNEDALSDQEGRDWIDQAVAYLNGQHYDTGYTSVLGSLIPNAGVDPATANEVEFFASVAALMARTAWWAGKGNWRDEEMSLDTSPFRQEWESLKGIFTNASNAGWFSGYNNPNEVNSLYNRDKVDTFGFANEPDDYHDATWWNE